MYDQGTGPLQGSLVEVYHRGRRREPVRLTLKERVATWASTIASTWAAGVDVSFVRGLQRRDVRSVEPRFAKTVIRTTSEAVALWQGFVFVRYAE
jgi:hypothetical protein